MEKVIAYIYNIEYENTTLINACGPDNLYQFERSIELKNEGHTDRLYGLESSKNAPKTLTLEFEVPNAAAFENTLMDDLDCLVLKDRIKEETGFTPLNYSVRIMYGRK